MVWWTDLHCTKARDAGWPDCSALLTETGDVFVENFN